ncbi:flagellar protein FlgN [Cohnella xylanilytica]|uniref:Flagellar protein FlgN n=1 Tax=Cohnella xylanilytica TaxID=557555 RepID=A0A841U1E3_9BACL|nr:flagellar protein FlgN [Cohnella xylanilytica]MBB6692183.1 flagellar protein FlgN [Cohnella xylanilytica]
MALERLYESMEILLGQHEKLLEMSEQKRQAIIRNDVSLLNELTTKESRLVRLIAETEQQRNQAVSDYYAAKGLRATSSATVSTIIRMETSFRDKERLTNLGERLTDVVNRLRSLNDLNTQLLRQAMEFNEFSINLLSGTDDDDVVYKRPVDQAGYSANARIFDSRA